MVGWAEFAGLRVLVDPGVFVPRRRSEFLVEVAVLLAGRQDGAVPRVVVDLCCGTGALGLAVAVKLARAADVRLGGVELHAADLDPAAVACARRNVEPAGGHVHAGDLFTALPDSLRGRAGVLICNAPYVPTTEIAFMPAEARDHEALMALDGGADGLAILRRAAADAPALARAWRRAAGGDQRAAGRGDGGRDDRRRAGRAGPRGRRVGRHSGHWRLRPATLRVPERKMMDRWADYGCSQEEKRRGNCLWGCGCCENGTKLLQGGVK